MNPLMIGIWAVLVANLCHAASLTQAVRHEPPQTLEQVEPLSYLEHVTWETTCTT